MPPGFPAIVAKRLRCPPHFHAQHYFTEGPVAYRLEWGGMAVVIGGDTAPVMTLAELSEAADVLVLDAMATALDNEKGVAGAEDGAPLEGSDGGGGGRGAAAGAARGTTVRERRNIVTSHTTPAEAGRMFAAAAPRLGEREGGRGGSGQGPGARDGARHPTWLQHSDHTAATASILEQRRA
jgi:hypothetical protein